MTGSGIIAPEDLWQPLPKNHPQITRLGSLLRLTGLDELPQVLNVLKGEMSLVGPRPTLPEQVETYTEYEKNRLSVKPGITGFAQIHGRDRIPWPKRIELDLYYINHQSCYLDFVILLRTVWVILKDIWMFIFDAGNKPKMP